jgi:transposase
MTAAAPLLLQCRQWGPRLTTIVTDRAYRGHFTQGLLAHGLRHEVSSRSPSARGFVPAGPRWIVERTFAWLIFFRRWLWTTSTRPKATPPGFSGPTLQTDYLEFSNTL